MQLKNKGALIRMTKRKLTWFFSLLVLGDSC